MEIESALVAHQHVAEAAVVSKPHDIKGESVFAFVVLNIARPEPSKAQSLLEELRVWVGEQLSPIAKPDEIRLTDNLPKTRSGKIMRRLLRSIARGEEITQDMSTLENPGILEQLRGGAAPPALKKRAGARTRVKAAKHAKVAAKRGKRPARVKRVKRKVVEAKSRRAAVKPARRKPVRGKPRGKK